MLIFKSASVINRGGNGDAESEEDKVNEKGFCTSSNLQHKNNIKCHALKSLIPPCQPDSCLCLLQSSIPRDPCQGQTCCGKGD